MLKSERRRREAQNFRKGEALDMLRSERRRREARNFRKGEALDT
jgi:hypothetical protein